MRDYKKLDNNSILPFLFFPRNEPLTPPPAGAIDVDIEVSPKIQVGCRFYLHNVNSPSILYFHGNGEMVCDYDMLAPSYISLGYNFIVASYRGYGWSDGSPTATNMMNDAVKIFEAVKLRLEKHDHSSPLLVMGRSLGSASAIELASTFPDDIKGLIIESGFADTLPLLHNLGADPASLEMTEEDGFGNNDKIASITLPTLIIHGSRDQIIPPSSAERLQATSGARTKQFHLIPGAEHNTMISTGGELYFETIKRFIDDLTGASNWRNRRKKYKSNG